MRRAVLLVVAALTLCGARRAAAFHPQAGSPRVVDGIAVRIENDIILRSQVRELGTFQQLIEGQAEPDSQLIDELIEQWVVESEASSAHFPRPAKAEIDREMSRLQDHFPSPATFLERLNELGLTLSQVRDLLSRQIFVERYLDYKFRPSVQVQPADIEAYYRNELIPDLTKRKEHAPSLPTVESQIREVLIQRGISNLTGKWLDDTKSRLRIAIAPAFDRSGTDINRTAAEGATDPAAEVPGK